MGKKIRKKKPVPEQPRESGKHWHAVLLIPFVSLVLIGLVGIIIYANSFDCSFHFDDFSNIVDNPDVHDVTDLRSIWKFNSRRFVGDLSFAFNYHVHQVDVFGYHLVNLLIHLGASLLVWRLVMLILATPVMRSSNLAQHKRLVALFCGLIFVAHPLQTQAVTYIVQRLAALATLFYLASLCLYLQGRLANRRRTAVMSYIGLAATFLAGIFTKEIVYTLPLMLVVFEFSLMETGNFREIVTGRRVLLYIVPPLAVSALILTFLVMKFGTYIIFHPSPSQRLLDPELTSIRYLMTQFRVIWVYLRLLVLPVGQNLDHDFPASLGFLTPGTTFIGFLFLLGLFGTAIRLFSRKRIIALGILWFFITLSVESSFKPLGNVMFEHRLYLPMFGYSLFVASVLYDLVGIRSLRAYVLIIVALMSMNAGLTFRRNFVWKDEITLWRDVVRKSPRKPRPYNNLANALSLVGRDEEAKGYLTQAIRLYPGYADAYNNLGIIYLREGNLEQARAMFERAIEINFYQTTARNNLGKVLLMQGHIQEAKASFQNALDQKLYHPEALNNMGDILCREGNFEEAITMFRRAVELDPYFTEAYMNLGDALYHEGRTEEAQHYYEKALSILPELPETYFNGGNEFMDKGKFDEAENQYRHAVLLKPGFAMAQVNLGIALGEQGKLNEAIGHLQDALAIDSGLFEAHYRLGAIFARRGNTEEAVTHLREAARLNPDHLQPHYLLVQCFKSLGKYDEANRELAIIDRLLDNEPK